MIRPCPLCRGRGIRIRLFKGSIDLARCQQCRTEFLSPLPSEQELADEYAGYFRKRNPGFPHPKLEYFQDLYRRLALDLSNKAVLELGAGEGDSIQALRGLYPTAELTAVEASQESPKMTHHCEWIALSAEDWLESGTQRRYSAILLFDVLEHFSQPSQLLNQLVSKHLEPGGWIVATFPNSGSLSRKLLGPFWFQYKLEHLTYPSRRGVQALAQNCGLETRHLRGHVKRLPWGYLAVVGAHFGPMLFRRLVRGMKKLLPSFVQKKSVALPLGELLWVAQRPYGDLDRNHAAK
jgi:hypothetical protein